MLLASAIGLGLDFVMMAIANSLWVLVVGRAMSGLFSASSATAEAYVADTVSEDSRSSAYGMLGAAISIGFIFGPALGGILGNVCLLYPISTLISKRTSPGLKRCRRVNTAMTF
jgi:DHA1 family tetracycline resistance protein-like MFS transporter